MITIPTHALLDMIGDMLPFVDTDKDSIATHCVRIEQAGQALTMLATNRAVAARVTWEPDNIPESPFSESLHSDFSVRITPTDAKAIVSAFKLPSKLDHAPIEISAHLPFADRNLYRLRVNRPAEPDIWSALQLDVTGRGVPIPDNGDVPEIDIHKMINEIAGTGIDMVALPGLQLSPRVLAALGKVERHGALKFAFRSTRDGAPFYVKAEAFDAVVFPVKERRDAYERAVGQASNVLRDGAGALVVGAE